VLISHAQCERRRSAGAIRSEELHAVHGRHPSQELVREALLVLVSNTHGIDEAGPAISTAGD
jgi:hypothetical protein